jgi:hypothetical protein
MVCSTCSSVLQHLHGMGQSVVVALAAHVECAERTAATTCPMPCTRYPTQQQVLQALTLPTAEISSW